MPQRKALGCSGNLTIEDLSFLRRNTPPESCEDIKSFLELRKEVFGRDEKDAQYRLKMCDGSMNKYVKRIWEENERIIDKFRMREREDRLSRASSCSNSEMDSPKSNSDPSR